LQARRRRRKGERGTRHTKRLKIRGMREREREE